MFVVVEGLDGTGKSTLARTLAMHMGAQLLRTPDESFADVRPLLDSQLSRSPRAHTQFYVSMVEYASAKTRHLLSMGIPVVMDRYWASTVAYDRVFRKSGLPFHALGAGLLTPSVTLFLEASRDVRQQRIQGRGDASAEDARGLDPEADRQLCQAYDAALVGHHTGEVIRIDVEGASPADVLRMAVNRIEADFALRDTLH